MSPIKFSGINRILFQPELVFNVGGEIKAHISPENTFLLGTQRKQKQDKQHTIFMPNANQTLAYPTQTIFYLLALSLLGFVLGRPTLALGLKGFLAVMLNKMTQCEWICILVGYRLNCMVLTCSLPYCKQGNKQCKQHQMS